MVLLHRHFLHTLVKEILYLAELDCGSSDDFITTVNVSPDAANAMAKIPVLGKVVEVITFEELKQEEKHSRIDVKTPSISGLENKGLQTNLNEKYIKENEQLYEQFKKR